MKNTGILVALILHCMLSHAMVVVNDGAGGAGVEVVGCSDCSSIRSVARSRCVSCLDRFLVAGVSAEAAGRRGRAPLHCSAVRGHTSIVVTLLEVGAYPGAVDADGCTALHLAVYMCHGYSALALLNGGVEHRCCRCIWAYASLLCGVAKPKGDFIAIVKNGCEYGMGIDRRLPPQAAAHGSGGGTCSCWNSSYCSWSRYRGFFKTRL